MSTPDSERASFEAWMQRDNPKYRSTDDGIQTRRDWAVWQAARASLPAPTGWQPLTDEDRDRAFQSLPNMLEGFMKKWGWLHYAKAIEAICREKNAAPSQDEGKTK